MALECLFSGIALQAVDAGGGMILPAFILRALLRRSDSRQLLLGPHEADPCTTGYDEAHQAWLYAEVERRRLRDETLGRAPSEHHIRIRRAFGAVEVAEVDPRGRIVLPPMTRRRSRIGEKALVVGTGGSFEIWNPDIAREAGDHELRELAAFAASGGAATSESEVAT